jgi:glycerophosphoryl diester phosphodiesterase
MAAFRRAAEMDAPEVETDVGYTKDGHLILFHDNRLDRTTNGTGLPEDYTLAELKQLDAGSWNDPALSWDMDYAGEKLITLQELLDEFGDRFIYHIEIKKPADGLVPDVLDAVRERGLIDRVYIAIIDHIEPLLEAKRIESGIKTAWAPVAAIKEVGSKAIEQATELDFTMITLASFNLDAALVKQSHDLGMECRSSGIRTRQHMIEAVEAGCNGMTINWPDWLMEYVRTN